MNKARRQKMFVDFEVQYVLLRKIAVHWVLFMLATAMALMIWIRLFSNPLGGWGETMETLFRQYTPVFIVSVVLLPVFLLDAAKLSNRFSGPMVRLRNTLTAIASGQKVRPLAFRKGDFWQGLAADFNQALEMASNNTNDDKSPFKIVIDPQHNQSDAS